MDIFPLQSCRNRRGFTLVEVLVAILIGLIIMAAVTGVFISHSRTYTTHDDIAATQQNLRGALMVMPAEFRLAGCDPLESHKPEILTANATTFEFTADLVGESKKHPNEADGEVDGAGERVAYQFCENTQTCSISGGVCRGDRSAKTRTPGRGVICRKVMPASGKWENASFQPLAGDIEKLEFNYIMRKGKGKFETTTTPRGNIGKISAVQISLLARGDFEDPAYRYSGDGFQPASWETEKTVWKLEEIYKDDPKTLERERHHRRRMLITTVQLRNMGN